MLEISGLTVTYGATHAVRGIDVEVGHGTTVGLLGPNGAGKTSSLRAVSGLEPYDGTVTFDGADLAGLPAETVARMGLIHVPEGRHVFPTLTVHENLQVGMTARAGRTDGYSVDEVYDLFTPLQSLRRAAGWSLSGGEQQMVAIGRALVAAPRLLLLDEPSLGLAPIIAQDVRRALQEVRDRTSMLIVEQNTALALGLCSEAHVLVAGEIVMRGTSTELGDRQTLLDSYLGQADVGAVS